MSKQTTTRVFLNDGGANRPTSQIHSRPEAPAPIVRVPADQPRMADPPTFDQFTIRYEVYQELRDVVTMVVGSGRVDSQTWTKAAEAAEKAQFLFGADVTTHLARFMVDLRDLECLVAEFDGLQGAERANSLKEQRNLKDSIEDFRTQAPVIFRDYICFDNKIR